MSATCRLKGRHGFRRIGALPDYYGPGKPALHMMHEMAAAPAAVATGS